MSDPRVVVLVDFDGTAAAQNVAETLLEHYGSNQFLRGVASGRRTERPFARAK